MPHVKTHLTTCLFGVIFAYFSVLLMGYSAAIPIPANIFEPIAQISPSFAFALVDALTLGLPLAIIYLLSYKLLNKIVKTNHLISPLLMLLPFVVLHAIFIILSFPNKQYLFYFASTFPKYVIVFACSIRIVIKM